MSFLIINNMRKTFFSLMVIFQGFGQGLIAQTNFWNSRNAYLGQTLPGDTPEIFAPRLLAGKGEFSANGSL